MDVFVYGTLTDPETARRVLGDGYEYGPETRLDGLHRVDGHYPTLAPGGSVEGRILHTERVAELDAYEDVDAGIYLRVAVPRERRGTVEVYVGDPARLDADAEWPGEGTFGDRVHEYLEGERVVIRPLDRTDH